MAKYEVTIKECEGTCNSNLFKKMAKNGDITAVSIKELIGKIVNITGFASCHITTDEKDFDINYFATDEGMFSTGSQVFLESVKNYFGTGEVDYFSIVQLKTKKGTTFKASPILKNEEEVSE